MTSRIFAAIAASLLIPLMSTGPASGGGGEPLAFVTSVSGSADLSSWPDAQGNTGLLAGDEICRQRAAAGSLEDPGGFIAWLSAPGVDAWCRVVTGASETLANNCGQPGLPPGNGPYRRVDGTPFLPRLDQAMGFNGRVYAPVAVDEFGQFVAPLEIYYTGTNASGAYAGGSCSGWTSAAGTDPVVVGSAWRTTAAWQGSGNTTCGSSLPRRLLCIHPGTSGMPPPREYGRPAFYTAVSGSGNLGSWPQAGGNTGVAAADAICRAQASAHGLPLPDTFKAWISVAGSDARDRFQFDGPWARLDGVRIADGLADLSGGRLRTSINLRPNGQYIGNGGAWTGTTSTGVHGGDDCGGWTSGDGGTRVGSVNSADSQWTATLIMSPCSMGFGLYCLSDSDQLFADDMEMARY